MAQPIVIAYHLVWTAYGWWFANDPRGSMSRSIRCDALRELGELHFGRKAAQPCSCEIRRFYDAAADWLKHDLLTFDRDDVAIVAEAFTQVIAAERYMCYAGALMPDHVHLCIQAQGPRGGHDRESAGAQPLAASRSRAV